MTPTEMLGALDAAIASTRGRRTIALRTRNAVVLGVEGHPLGRDERGTLYGFTRTECQRMRETILAAAREDLAHAQQRTDG